MLAVPPCLEAYDTCPLHPIVTLCVRIGPENFSREKSVVSGMITSFKKKKKRQYKKKHMCGFKAALLWADRFTKKAGQLFDALPVNRHAFNLWSPRGQPETRWAGPPAPCPPHALPCLHQPAVPVRDRHDGWIEVACQSQTETKNCQKFPEKTSSQEISRHFSQALQKSSMEGSAWYLLCQLFI